MIVETSHDQQSVSYTRRVRASRVCVSWGRFLSCASPIKKLLNAGRTRAVAISQISTPFSETAHEFLVIYLKELKSSMRAGRLRTDCASPLPFPAHLDDLTQPRKIDSIVLH